MEGVRGEILGVSLALLPHFLSLHSNCLQPFFAGTCFLCVCFLSLGFTGGFLVDKCGKICSFVSLFGMRTGFELLFGVIWSRWWSLAFDLWT